MEIDRGNDDFLWGGRAQSTRKTEEEGLTEREREKRKG
jgi:hypothetical protein